jgi:hypothetical protein
MRSEVRTLDGFFLGVGINEALNRTIQSVAQPDRVVLKQRTTAGGAGESLIWSRAAA